MQQIVSLPLADYSRQYIEGHLHYTRDETLWKAGKVPKALDAFMEEIEAGAQFSLDLR